jgi:predicted nucleotidyltransferase
MGRREMDRDVLAGRLREVLEPRTEVLEAYLFGSAAHGRAQPHSDVDVAVFVNEALCEDGEFGYRAGLMTALMEGLGSNEVDVVILNHAPPLLYHRVLRDGIRVLARDLRTTTGREARALSRYCDLVPLLDMVERVAADRQSTEVSLP